MKFIRTVCLLICTMYTDTLLAAASKSATAIVILGAPASGKGYVCNFMRDNFGFDHISTGDLLRSNGGNSKTKDDISSGKLVNDDKIFNLLESRIKDRKSDTILLDGVPRSLEQAKKLTHFLNRLNIKLKKVIAIECPMDVLIDRMSKRKISEGRSDDTEDTFNKRVSLYNNNSPSIIKYYTKNKYNITRLNCTSKDILSDAAKSLDLKN